MDIRPDSLYIDHNLRGMIRERYVVLAGLGIGSVIAETLIRTGFKKLCLIDGDVVEMSNLNRQNYTADDVGKSKAFALRDRLNRIDPEVEIAAFNEMITRENCSRLLSGADFVINTVDFDDNRTSLDIEKAARYMEVPSIFPLNLGWAGAVFVCTPESPSMARMFRDTGTQSISENFIKHIVKWLVLRNSLPRWYPEAIKRYMAARAQAEASGEEFKEPQLNVGCQMLAAMTTSVICSLLLKESVPTFPDLVFQDARTYHPSRLSLWGSVRAFFKGLRIKKELAAGRSG